MPKVFIPHIVTRFDEARGRVIPAMDFSSAAKVGDLHYVLGESINPLFFQQSIDTIEKVLSDVTDRDFLLPVGDPTIIAACAAIIARNTGKLNMLKWDKRLREYIQVRGELNVD